MGEILAGTSISLLRGLLVVLRGPKPCASKAHAHLFNPQQLVFTALSDSTNRSSPALLHMPSAHPGLPHPGVLLDWGNKGVSV